MRVDRSEMICQSWRHSPLGGTAALKCWNVRSDAVKTPSCSPQDVPGRMTSAYIVVCVMKMSSQMKRSSFLSASMVPWESGSVWTGSSP